MRRRSPQAAAGGTEAAATSKTIFSTEEATESMEGVDAAGTIEQRGLLLEIDDGSSDEPKKGGRRGAILRLNDPLHSYQGRRRCLGLLLIMGLLTVLYLGT